MPESSVDSYINAQPEVATSFDDYWKEHNAYGIASNPDQLMVKVMNAFTGEDKRVKREYEAYLANLNNRNEFLAQQSARSYDRMMDDSKVQRLMKDYEAAGLNPYLLVNNGSVSAGSVPASLKANYSQSRKAETTSQNGRNMALLLLAVARIAAAFL